jgi:hypothetical protein
MISSNYGHQNVQHLFGLLNKFILYLIIRPLFYYWSNENNGWKKIYIHIMNEKKMKPIWMKKSKNKINKSQKIPIFFNNKSDIL